MSWDDMYRSEYIYWNRFEIGPVNEKDPPSLSLYDKEGFDLAWNAATRRVKERHASSNCQCMTCQSRKITQSETIRRDLTFKVTELEVEVNQTRRQMKNSKLSNRLARYLLYYCTISCTVMFILGSWIPGSILAVCAIINHLQARASRDRYYKAVDEWLTKSEDLANTKLELELLK